MAAPLCWTGRDPAVFEKRAEVTDSTKVAKQHFCGRAQNMKERVGGGDRGVSWGCGLCGT